MIPRDGGGGALGDPRLCRASEEKGQPRSEAHVSRRARVDCGARFQWLVYKRTLAGGAPGTALLCWCPKPQGARSLAQGRWGLAGPGPSWKPGIMADRGHPTGCFESSCLASGSSWTPVNDGHRRGTSCVEAPPSEGICAESMKTKRVSPRREDVFSSPCVGTQAWFLVSPGLVSSSGVACQQRRSKGWSWSHRETRVPTCAMGL